MKNNKILGHVHYIDGDFTHGHHELILSDEEYAVFVKLPEREQKKILHREGHFVVDDYRVFYTGDISHITVEGGGEWIL